MIGDVKKIARWIIPKTAKSFMSRINIATAKTKRLQYSEIDDKVLHLCKDCNT